MVQLEESNNQAAANLASQEPLSEPTIDKTAISPYQTYCDGFVSPGANGNGYVSTLKVATGTTTRTDDILLDGIVAYDRAEVTGSYIGQINMITASSFNGLAGQVWGYDLARNEELDRQKSLFEVKQFDGTNMQVYDAEPLLTATEALFGTVNKRRFPLLPGAHTICANKGVTAYRPRAGEKWNEGDAYGVWCYISISFARDREIAANCFIEDAGLWQNDKESELTAFLEEHRRAVANCTVQCGADSRVAFDKSYIGYAYCIMEEGDVGTAITVGPYITLAQKAVPNGQFDMLKQISLSQWDAIVPR